MSRLFGVEQEHYGADNRWIFTEEAIVEQTGEPVEDGDLIESWPIGGSNSGPSSIVELKTDQDIIDFLTGDAYGVYDDPMLCDCGEYYLSIDTDDRVWGSVTGEYVKKLGLNPAELSKNDDCYGSCATIEAIADYFREIGYDDFDYEDPFYGEDSEMRLSELIDLYHEVDPDNTLGI